MATYKEISTEARRLSGRAIKTCWIAHVLSDHGLTTRKAPNRRSPTVRVHPCPAEMRPIIERALRNLGRLEGG